MASNEAAELIAHDLRTQLSAKGLSVHVQFQPPGVPPVEGGRLSRFLMIMNTEVQYALMPVEGMVNRAPHLVPSGARSGPGQWEINEVPKDLGALATRVEERIRAGP